jgi:hypothetical protein
MRGLETFAQLMVYNQSTREYGAWPTEVLDWPRFAYRGVMLDTSRHFLSTAAIRGVMEAMSYLKLNVLHLHLTDDNSFPVVVAKWPRLAAVSAYSNFSHTYSAADLAAILPALRQHCASLGEPRLRAEWLDARGHIHEALQNRLIRDSFPEALSRQQAGAAGAADAADAALARWNRVQTVFLLHLVQRHRAAAAGSY